MRSVAVVLAVGLAFTVLAGVAVLSQSPLTVAGGDSIPAKADVELERGDAVSCQPGGTLPRGTSAIRVAIEARAVGPTVTLRAYSGSHLVSQGQRAAGWGAAPTVTVPVNPLPHAVVHARICVALGATVEPVRLHGSATDPSSGQAGSLQGVALSMEYLRPGRESWWSLASSIAYRMGLGRAASGSWIVFLALALMLAVAVLAARLALRELR
jgi:hypothetical protein